MNDFYESNFEAYSKSNLDSKNISYLEKYWMTIGELSSNWAYNLVEANKIISKNTNNNYSINLDQAGFLFTKTNFEIFKAEAIRVGANKFAVIEDIEQIDWLKITDNTFFRFCYPIEISWEDMVPDDSIAYDVYERPIRCFYVLLDNSRAGKYVNNDDESPYEIHWVEKGFV